MDEGYHCSYICVYVGDIIYLGKKTNDFFAILEKLKYKLRGVGPPTYNFGSGFKRFNDQEKMLTRGALTYAKRMMTNYKNTFGMEVTKK